MITNPVEQTVEICGTTVNYVKRGEGSPVIMMHGWGCEHSHLKTFEDVAAEGCCVYNLDLPGFGKSPEPPQAWGVEEYTRMLEEFVKKLNITAPVLLGHSFGGRIALLYSSRNETRGLILVDAAGVKPSMTLKKFIKIYSYKLGKSLYPLIFGKEKAQKLIEAKRAKSGSADYRSASPLMRAVLVKAVNTDLRKVMPMIQAPTQLIWGEEDTATPIRDAHIMQKLIPNVSLAAFPGAGHFSFIDNPFQSAAVLRRFLNKLKDA